MADTRLIRLTWENDVQFKMDTKLNDEDWLTIIEMDENGNISQLWEHAGALCKKYFETQVDFIGGVMKS
ncbi:hypothetical protein LCGC14_0387740 [marine sediment metagenome]|uniref:Uncharacterized protein n=1 Tax=marine sediment metagenome TaxID=412755 RepID=A0A0F9TII5_9ZZZZ